MALFAFPVTFAVLPLLFIVSTILLIRHYRNPQAVGVRTPRQTQKPNPTIWGLIIPVNGTELYLHPIHLVTIRRCSLVNGITSLYVPEMTALWSRYRKPCWRGWGIRISNPVPHNVTGLAEENGEFCEGFGGLYFGFKTYGLDDAAENKTLRGSGIRGDVVIVRGVLSGLRGVEIPYADMPAQILLPDNEWVWEGIVATLAKA